MPDDLMLRRKWAFRFGGRRIVFTKKENEGVEHVLMKALLRGLYASVYPAIEVEVAIDSRFKPDLIQLNDHGQAVFWGEAGRVSAKKMRSLVTRHRNTHFAFGKWHTDLSPFRKMLDKAVKTCRRGAPIDLISFPHDSAERFIDHDGCIDIRLSDLNFIRWDPE